MARRVLLVTYCWPPRGGVGLIRPWKWATYLPRFGWEVVVLTPSGAPSPLTVPPELGSLPGVDVVEVPYRSWRPVRPAPPAAPAAGAAKQTTVKGLPWRRTVAEVLGTPDDLWPWYWPAMAAVSQRLAKGDIQAVVSTSPPETVHGVARGVQRRFGIPWVADLRDLWSQDHFRDWPRWKAAVLAHMERRLLRHANGLTTVSQGLMATERALLGPGRRLERIIPNGFDPEELRGLQPTPYQPFTILYTGKLHAQHQDPRPLLQAIALLRSRRHLTPERFQVHFHLYGANQPDLAGMAAELGVVDLVHQLPPVDNETVLRHQLGAHVLYLAHWMGPNRQGWLSGKVFDYLGSRRPVLCQGDPDEEVCRLLSDTGAGVAAPDAAGLADYLQTWFDTWDAQGRLDWASDAARLEPYTRQHGARELALLLDELCSGSRPATSPAAMPL